MADKVVARNMMKSAGVPIIPGSDGPVSDAKAAIKIAQEIGYPVIVKAAGGGGGKGMRLAADDIELHQAFADARKESMAAFGNSAVYIEKYFDKARHIEVQILADSSGNVVHLGERDCTTQRRYQKLIEEAPSPVIDSKLRKNICKAAVSAAKAVGYENAGTVEFLFSADRKFYFMEMNTRLQVEHAVTEMVTGIDIVEQQINIAAGILLPYRQKDIRIKGHAIECRINAEDPDDCFFPCPGTVEFYHPPLCAEARIDTCLFAGCEVPRYYDSMVAKIVTYGKTRTEAIQRMRKALTETAITGIVTTIPFHLRMLKDEAFLGSSNYTTYVDNEFLSQKNTGGLRRIS
jgi:acetyl-CoA carboxylase biotin carboxylase subunit